MGGYCCPLGGGGFAGAVSEGGGVSEGVGAVSDVVPGDVVVDGGGVVSLGVVELPLPCVVSLF